MSTEELTIPPAVEQAGILLGRAYVAAVAALAAPIRRPETPTWHWRLARRAGRRLRAAAGGGADLLERRARTAPRRLVSGLKRLWTTAKGNSFQAFAARTGTTAFLAWWGGEWAVEAGVSLRGVGWSAAGVLLLVAYGVGSEPAKRSLTRREKARQDAAVRGLLSAIHHMIHQQHGLHLADLADQITARSQARGTPVKCTVASLRALLEPLGVPIRDQLAIGNLNRPGIHAGDWAVWAARHGAPTLPTPGAGEPSREEETVAPTREAALPHAETADETIPLDPVKPQVADSGLEISARDLDQDTPSGKGPHLTYTAEQLRLIEYARTAAGEARGAHLRTILSIAQAAGDYTDWTVNRLRRELEALDIKVEEKLWLNGGNTRGVLVVNLPSRPEKETR